MIRITAIFEDVDAGVVSYLQKRNLIKQYKKAKKKILDWYTSDLDLKERKPKDSGIYSFRINRQYRAFGIIQDDVLIIFEMNNHQNF